MKELGILLCMLAFVGLCLCTALSPGYMRPSRRSVSNRTCWWAISPAAPGLLLVLISRIME